jgi:hypothetical protein
VVVTWAVESVRPQGLTKPLLLFSQLILTRPEVIARQFQEGGGLSKAMVARCHPPPPGPNTQVYKFDHFQTGGSIFYTV